MFFKTEGLWKKVGIVGLYLFAAIGIFFSSGYAAMRLHLTDDEGHVDFRDRYLVQAESNSRNGSSGDLEERCRLEILTEFFPATGDTLYKAYRPSASSRVLARLLNAAEVYMAKDSPYWSRKEVCATSPETIVDKIEAPSTGTVYPWVESEEWSVLKDAIRKDTALIQSISQQTGIGTRLLIAQLVGEQLRLFHSEREVYKQFFAPLKILGNETQFSWGVFGIKEETAKQIEANLKNPLSPYYLGPAYEHMLDFKTADINKERFERLTDEDDRTYSYLYAALFLKQVDTQWKKAGFPISDRPEILSTLFNIGFRHSEPKVNPEVGGADIEISGQQLTFGTLAHQFYYSGELAEELPFDVE